MAVSTTAATTPSARGTSMLDDPELEYISRKALRAHKKRLAAELRRAKVSGESQEWRDLHREESLVKRKDHQKLSVPRKTMNGR